MKNVLVIGGSYFLGKVFVEELRGKAAITVVNRGTRPLQLEGVTELVCERHDTAKLKQVVPGQDWDTVIDFGAYEPKDVEALLPGIAGRIGQYVLISTTTIYQDSIQIPMREDAAPLTGPRRGLHGEYGYNKLLAENTSRELCKQRGAPVTILRPSFIYGKYNYAPRESYFFDLIQQRKFIVVPFLPQALFTAASVWDVARICIGCLGNDRVYDQAYNVCSDELISYDRLVQVLEVITGRRLDVQRQSIERINAARLPLPFPLDEHLVYSGAKLQQALGFQYMSFLEGMRLTYNWYTGKQK